MHANLVTIDQRASIAMGLLPADQRTAVLTAFERLSTRPEKQWPKAGVRLLKPEDSLSVLRVAPDLNVFFTHAEPGRFVIVDVLRQGALDFIAREQPVGHA